MQVYLGTIEYKSCAFTRPRGGGYLSKGRLTRYNIYDGSDAAPDRPILKRPLNEVSLLNGAHKRLLRRTLIGVAPEVTVFIIVFSAPVGVRAGGASIYLSDSRARQQLLEPTDLALGFAQGGA